MCGGMFSNKHSNHIVQLVYEHDSFESEVKRYGVLYPMQTFSKQREVDFNTVPFFLEASAPAEVEMCISDRGTADTPALPISGLILLSLPNTKDVYKRQKHRGQ